MDRHLRDLRRHGHPEGQGPAVSERSLPPDEAEQFWNKHGWLISGVWLIFLTFPLMALLEEPYPLPLKVLGIGLIVLFAVIYVRGYARFSHTVGHGGTRSLEAYGYFAVLCALVLGSIPLLDAGVLSMLPFISSYAAFLLRRPAVYATYAVVLVLCFALPLIYDVLLGALFLIGLNMVLMVVYLITVMAIERSVAAEAVRADFLVLSEQERMARDVHDGIGHSLTALNLKAQLALRLIDNGKVQQARSEVEQLSELAVAALDSVRTTVHGLSHHDLAEQLAAVREACEANGISFTVIGQPDMIPTRWRSHASWILREALTNVWRHAHASRVRVVIGPASLSVDDDGDGLQGSEPGHGIRGMYERARLLGAEFELGTSNLGGVSVRLTFPVTEGD
ncbi:sensor histidine kinase [Glutamicibacter endophyticus]